MSLRSWVSLNRIPRVAFLERNLYDLNIKMLVRRYDNRLTQFNRQLLFSTRLATLAERIVNMNQRRTESTLSLNRQSELQAEYKNDLRDGRRVDAVELIEKKLKKGRSQHLSEEDQLKAYRLACYIFEVICLFCKMSWS